MNETLQKQGVAIKEAELEMIPKNTVKVEDEESAEKVLALIESLEDSDDVQNVWANFDIDDELLEKLGSWFELFARLSSQIPYLLTLMAYLLII